MIINEFKQHIKDNDLSPSTINYMKFKIYYNNKQLDEGFANAVYLDNKTAPDGTRGIK